jgi:UDP-N-acetyl-2-amino-2-deoxyglucuronate dehydrogenase
VSAEVGVGIVGAGTIFEQHALALSDLSDRARIVALCEVDDARRTAVAARHSIPFACRDHHRLVEHPDVDLVVVATPPRFHADIAINALRAGKHVVCEKPLALTLDAADRVIEVARAHPGRLSVAYQFRYLPEVRRALWLRDSGLLGRLIYGRFHRFARFRRPGKPQRAAWWGRWGVAGGGALITQLIHELDLAFHLFGRPLVAWGVIDTLKEEIESEDACAAVVRFVTGAIVSFQATMSAHRSSAGFDAIGTLGSAHAPWAFECLDRRRHDEVRGAALEAVPEAAPGGESSDHTPYLAAVLEALAAGTPLPVGPEEARMSLELTTAIYASALRGEPVALPIAPGGPGYDGISALDYERRTAIGGGVVVAG